MGSSRERALQLAEVLNEPVRGRLYEYVRSAAPAEVSRDAAAAALEISRSLAAFHLDRLVEAGLLEPVFRRLTNRSGPGAGRPAKLYRPSQQSIELSVPARHYELAAEIMAAALGLGESRHSSPRLRAAAGDRGRALGAEAQAAGKDLRRTLGDLGYEPVSTEDGLRLRNCPFHRLAESYRLPVCEMNLALQEGLVAELGSPVHPVLRPEAGWCCIHYPDQEET